MMMMTTMTTTTMITRVMRDDDGDNDGDDEGALRCVGWPTYRLAEYSLYGGTPSSPPSKSS